MSDAADLPWGRWYLKSQSIASKSSKMNDKYTVLAPSQNFPPEKLVFLCRKLCSRRLRAAWDLGLVQATRQASIQTYRWPTESPKLLARVHETPATDQARRGARGLAAADKYNQAKYRIGIM